MFTPNSKPNLPDPDLYSRYVILKFSECVNYDKYGRK